MADNKPPDLPQRIAGTNLPAEAYVARTIGRTKVGDYRYRTDPARVRILLNALRRWSLEEQ